MSTYQKISYAIDYIVSHQQQQPSLEDIAQHVHLSPFHFQRLFSQWVGLSPKRFLQVMTVEEARQRLNDSKPILEVSEALGLSSSSRLYDHFVQLEAATPGEVKSGGAGLIIEWGQYPSPFGEAFIALTPRGICKLAFIDENYSAERCLAELHSDWPQATLQPSPETAEKLVSALFKHSTTLNKPLSLHLSGSNFQIQVWRALLQIQPGEFSSYGKIATALGKSGAARAIGRAVGSNPVALLIPCHRVIRQTGELGGYRWGLTRKRAIHTWEMAQLEQ